jgi:hypothetical protein
MGAGSIGRKDRRIPKIGQSIGRRGARLVLAMAVELVALGSGLVSRLQEAAGSYEEETACADMEEAYWQMFAAAEAAHNRGDQTWFNVYCHSAQGIQRSARQMGCYSRFVNPQTPGGGDEV